MYKFFFLPYLAAALIKSIFLCLPFYSVDESHIGDQARSQDFAWGEGVVHERRRHLIPSAAGART